MFNLIKLCENYELLKPQTKKRVLILRETLETSKKTFHFNVDLMQGITKYIIKMCCLVSNSSYDERMFYE
jgi:hypothetical protein